MRSLITLTMSLMTALSTPGSATEPPAPAGFAMELIVPEGLRPAGDIEVHCLEGCDWSQQTITCPPSPQECRGVVASRSLYERSARSIERPRGHPLPGTVCLGINVNHEPPPEYVQKCEPTNGAEQRCRVELIPGPETRAYAQAVMAGSPAEAAGLKPGDVLLNLMGQRVQTQPEMVKISRTQAAGQPFDLVIARDGAEMTLSGQFGVLMSEGGCAALDSSLLAASKTPSAPAPLQPFKLVIQMPGDTVTFNCFEGCERGISGDLGCGPACAFGINQDDKSTRLVPAPWEFFKKQ